MRGGLVQEEEGGVPPQERPGEGQPLALAARELEPLLADPRVEPFRQALHQVVEAGRAQGGAQLRLARARGGDDEVLAHGSREQVRALGGEGDRLAHAVGGPRPPVAPVEEEAPRGDVPEAQEEVDEGGLAGAARAHDGNAPPGLEAEAHPVEREAGLAGVGEAQVAHFEDERGPARAGRLGLDDRGRLARCLEEPVRRFPREGQARPRRGQAGHRLERGEGEEGHDGQVDAVELSRADGRDRQGEDRDHRQVRAEARERPAKSGGARETLLLPDRLAAQRPDRRREIGLPLEGEHLREALHAVHELGRELATERGEASPRVLFPAAWRCTERPCPSPPGRRRRPPPGPGRRAAGRAPRAPSGRSQRRRARPRARRGSRGRPRPRSPGRGDRRCAARRAARARGARGRGRRPPAAAPAGAT